jgi:pimeloyl-ACP methyl ester carboxylesterase
MHMVVTQIGLLLLQAALAAPPASLPPAAAGRAEMAVPPRAQVGEAPSGAAGPAIRGATASEVRFRSEPGVDLTGTLYLPTGQGKGPFPLAVLIAGHGPGGRGNYLEIIRRLTADGIAALEYDKRGTGRSTGTYEEDSYRLAADAAAAVAAMRHRPDIVGGRIALVGHSGGGVIAPAVAAADPGIAAVVTLAGNVGDGLSYVRKGIHAQILRMTGGGREALAGPAADAVMALLQARVDGRDADTVARLRATVVDRLGAAGFPRPQAEQALAMIDVPEAWGASKLRSASDLKALHMPVLAVYGTRDPMALDDAPAARSALTGNRSARVVMLDGLGHSFREGEVTGTPEEAASLGPYLGSPRLATLVGDWLRDTLSKGEVTTGRQR